MPDPDNEYTCRRDDSNYSIGSNDSAKGIYEGYFKLETTPAGHSIQRRPPKTDSTCYKTVLVSLAVVVFGAPLGLFFTANEFIKAYRDDRANGARTLRIGMIAPTLLLSAAAGYTAFTYAGMLAGLMGATLATGGIALAVFAAVSLTSAVVVLLTKLAIEHTRLTPPKHDVKKPHITHGVIEQIAINAQQIKLHRFAPFWTDEAEKIRTLGVAIQKDKTWAPPGF